MTRRILLPLPMILLAATLSVACLEKPADDGDAGLNNNNAATDGGADAEATPDAAVNCQPEDLVSQLTCGSGRKCTLTDPQNHVGCAPTGYTSAYASCTDERPDECALATLCSDADEPGRFVCLPFCDTLGAACLNGKCTHSISLAGGGTTYLCSPADGCDPVTGTGCDAGLNCYLDRVSGGLTFCVSDLGVVPEGGVCTSEYACQPGLTCFGPMNTEGVIQNGECRTLCHAGNDADCGGGSCNQFTPDYGICFN